MMPAASNKTDSKTTMEVMDPSKMYIGTLEKKVRNIEKRKSKLDAVRMKQAAGETLENEQKEAIKHYDEVTSNLEFVRELQKSFSAVQAEIEKANKKMAKKEKQEKVLNEHKRVTEMVKVQSTLNALGSDRVRDDFKTGNFGAVVLTEDNLTSLDELFQLLNPARDGEEDFAQQLSTASDHFINLLESRDRPVAGSTYKELFETINLVNSCGYFERAKEAQQSTPESPEDATEEVEEEEEVEVVGAEMASDEGVQQPERVPAPEVVANNSFFSQTTSPAAPPAFQPSPPQQTEPEPMAARARPLPEIMSSVRGTFNFLQESEIELDSPHNDPAVVAAQPMMRPPSAGSASLLPPGPGGFPPAPSMVDQARTESPDPLSLSQQSMNQGGLDFSGASQTFAQAGLSHSQGLSGPVVTDTLFQSSVEDSSTPTPQQQQQPQPPSHAAHGMMGQGRGAGEPSGQFDLPPSIPMPPSQSADGSQLTVQEKKFQLNASATEFQSRSVYSQMPPSLQSLSSQPPPPQSQGAHQQQNNGPDARPMPPPSTVNADFPSAPNFAQAAGDFSQANNFQGGGFQRGGRGGGPGGYRGGQRGGRGATNNGNGVQNGFNGRPQNGNGRPNNRGNASFQGYPPRNNYRPRGYQGFNTNTFGEPVPYQKPGGAMNPGFPRGGGGNSRGAGGMRNEPRGAPPRGAGGNRGGLNRPVAQQQ